MTASLLRLVAGGGVAGAAADDESKSRCDLAKVEVCFIRCKHGSKSPRIHMTVFLLLYFFYSAGVDNKKNRRKHSLLKCHALKASDAVVKLSPRAVDNDSLIIRQIEHTFLSGKSKNGNP